MDRSFIIITRNKKEFLYQTLKTVYKNKQDKDEIIVIDDESMDGTKEMVREEFPDARYKRITHKGYALARMRNIGIRMSKFNCLVLMDDDLLLPEGYIEEMRKCYDPETLVTGKFKREKQGGGLTEDWRLTNSTVRKVEIKEDIYEMVKSDDGFLVHGICGAVMFSKKKAKEIGFYDTDFDGKWGAEDSISGETPVVLLRDGNIEFIPIEDLYNGADDGTEGLNRVKVLTKNGFKNANYVYKHITDKQILRTRTRTGIITTTNDHSLFSDGIEKRPKELKKGDKLDLIDIPIVDKGNYIKDAWYQGLFAAEGNVFMKNYRYKRKRIINGKKWEGWENNLVKSVSLGMIDKKMVEKFADYYNKNSQGKFRYKITKVIDERYILGKIYVANLCSQKHKREIVEKLRKRYYTKNGEKKVPIDILNADKKTAKEFLDGFLVGDGCIVKQKNRTDTIWFTTKSQTLVAGVEYLLKKIGKNYTVSTRKDKKNAFNIKVLKGGVGNNQFIKRNIPTIKDNGDIREIYDVSKDYKGLPVYDINTEDGTFVIGIGGILAHNSFFGIKWAYHGGKVVYMAKKFAVHQYHPTDENKKRGEQRENRKLLIEKVRELSEVKANTLAFVIHTFMRDEEMKRCVNSIKECVKGIDFKICVSKCRIYISDSGHRSPEKDKYYEQLRKDGHKIIELPFDINWTAARNELIKKVKEDCVMYLDDDFILTPKTNIRALIEILESREDIGMVGSGVETPRGLLQYNFKIEGEAGDIKYRILDNSLVDGEAGGYKYHFCDVIPNCFLAKREIFNKGAIWDEELNVGSGHSDFMLNIKFNTDWKIVYTNDCIIKHAHSGTKEYMQMRRRKDWQQRFFDKWNSGNEIPRIKEGHIINDKIIKETKTVQQEPKISFLIKTIERPTLLKTLLCSIAKYSPLAYISIADDGKAFDAQWYKKMWNELKEMGLKNKPIAHNLDYDKGLSYGRNFLVDHTDGRFVLLMDDDFIFTSDTKIEKFVKVMNARPDIGVVGGMLIQDGTERHFEGTIKKVGRDIIYSKDKEDWKVAKSVRYRETDCVFNFCLIRREVFKSVRWDERFKISGEHSDWALRLKETKWKVAYCPEVKVIHKQVFNPEYKRLRARKQFLKLLFEKHNVDRLIFSDGLCYEYLRAEDSLLTYRLPTNN